MTDPLSAERSDLPDAARLRAEIEDDRRHERFLVRAAVIAVVLVAIVIATRVLWP